MKIGIFGTGAYGLALSSILSENNCEITMWTKFISEKEQLEKTRENELLLPGYELLPNVEITNDIEFCVKDKDLLIIVIPAAYVEDLCINLKPYINDNNILIATKGIEQKEGLLMHEIVSKYLKTTNIGVLSGPTFAIDIIDKCPIGLSLATKSLILKEKVLKSFSNNYTKIELKEDMIGLEICGSIKNVFAIASGILDAQKCNNSTKALFFVESLKSIEKIIYSLNGDINSILSYAGVGDLFLTCNSSKSRNFSFGQLIGNNITKEKKEFYLNNTTVEGVYTLKSIYKIIKDKELKVPLIEVIYEIVINNQSPIKLIDVLANSNFN